MTSAIDMIKEEKINVVAFFHKANGDIRAGYLCTKEGSEVVLEPSFFEQYNLEETWGLKDKTTGSINTYIITDKTDNSIVYTQD